MFSETGRAELIEADGDVFDEFIAPSITTGVGRSETQFFVDGNHSMVTNITIHHPIHITKPDITYWAQLTQPSCYDDLTFLITQDSLNYVSLPSLIEKVESGLALA